MILKSFFKVQVYVLLSLFFVSIAGAEPKPEEPTHSEDCLRALTVDQLPGQRIFFSEDGLLGTVIKRLRKIVASPYTNGLLIEGSTGTGKELIAQLFWQWVRKEKQKEIPLTIVDCGMFQGNEAVANSLLFGHVKGSFTDASKNHTGYFQRANHGAIFLDEFQRLPIGVQQKILRVIQAGVIEPIGGDPIHITVKVILASNVSLKNALSEGTLLSDLYYRIQAYPAVQLPLLFDRQSEIIPLARALLSQFQSTVKGSDRVVFSSAVEDIFINHQWPGNVRELENTIRQALIDLDRGAKEITVENLPDSLRYAEEDIFAAKIGLFKAYLNSSLPFHTRLQPLEDRYKALLLQMSQEVEQGSNFQPLAIEVAKEFHFLHQVRRNLNGQLMVRTDKNIANNMGITYDQYRHYKKQYINPLLEKEAHLEEE